MWPRRRMAQYISSLRELQELETQSTPESPRRRADNNFNRYSDDETESIDEVYHVPDAPVDIFLFTSIGSYAAVQQTPAVRQLTCECTEMLSVPNSMYYPTSVTPESSTDDDQSDQESENDDMAFSEVEENVSLESEYNHELTRQPRKIIKAAKVLPIPEPTQARRRRLRSVQRPPPKNPATYVANRVVRYARCIRNMHEKDVCCLNCGLFPNYPVTGSCGHTRCIKCIEEKRTCPCGNNPPENLSINILIRDIVQNTTAEGQSFRTVSEPTCTVTSGDISEGQSSDTIGVNPNQPLIDASDSSGGFIQRTHKLRAGFIAPYSRGIRRIPMSPRARYNHALKLMRAGRHRDAAPHFALAAASCQPELRTARTLLAGVITVISKNQDPKCLIRPLYRMVRHLSSKSWIKLSDMECILCCDIFTDPVTTPCGHMFCRTCIERTLDYRKRCPLCIGALHDFNLAETRNTLFVEAALCSINAINMPQPPEPDLIPIFVCTVAYPSVPCPLIIFDPRYWLMIRRVLESGSRKFGMVTCDRDQNYVDYGTILEVRDCVHLEDGRFILSTIGISRFKVIERSIKDGCEVARVLHIKDVVPVSNLEVVDLKFLGSQIMFKAMLWLDQLNSKVLADIVAAFGSLPEESVTEDEWWGSPDGPTWLWWLVAVLPLRSEIKVLILSTNCLLKRMLAVFRTLEAVDQVTLADTVPSQFEIQNSVSSNNQAVEGGDS